MSELSNFWHVSFHLSSPRHSMSRNPLTRALATPHAVAIYHGIGNALRRRRLVTRCLLNQGGGGAFTKHPPLSLLLHHPAWARSRNSSTLSYFESSPLTGPLWGNHLQSSSVYLYLLIHQIRARGESVQYRSAPNHTRTSSRWVENPLASNTEHLRLVAQTVSLLNPSGWNTVSGIEVDAL